MAFLSDWCFHQLDERAGRRQEPTAGQRVD
jgi:hypothetical protein